MQGGAVASRRKPSERAPVGVSIRPVMERALLIHEAIASGNFPNCTYLANSLELHRQTVLRDIEFMRDRLNLPVAYSAARRGYYYTEPVVAFPTSHLVESEALALLLAEFAFESFPGLAKASQLRDAVRKITGPALQRFQLSREELGKLVQFRPSRSVTPMDETLIPPILEGLMNGTKLTCEYRKAGANGFRKRTVHPLQLRWVEGVLYLLCEDPGAPEEDRRRIFALPRMRNVVATGIPFEAPAAFDPDKELENSIGIHGGGEVETVQIRFTGSAIFFAKERLWHPSQVLVENADGSVELHLRVALNPELDRWILRWGGDAEVLAPTSLKERIQDHARRMLGGGVIV